MINELSAEEALVYVKKRKKLLDDAVVTNFQIAKLQSNLKGINQKLGDMDRELRSESPKLIME